MYTLRITTKDSKLIIRKKTAKIKVGASVKRGLKGEQGPPGNDGADGVDGSDGVIQSIVAGENITVDNADPANPIVSASGGGGGGAWEIVADVTLTSDAPEIAVSGLNLDTDGIYKIEAWNLDSVLNNAVFCVNEETPSITPAGWQCRTIRVESSITYVNQNPSLALNGTVGTFRGTITKVVGGKTFINFDNMRSDGRYSISSQYKTATTNITKIRIATTDNSDMKAGARMVITRLSA